MIGTSWMLFDPVVLWNEKKLDIFASWKGATVKLSSKRDQNTKALSLWIIKVHTFISNDHQIPPGPQYPSEHPENNLRTSRQHLENIKTTSIEYLEKIQKHLWSFENICEHLRTCKHILNISENLYRISLINWGHPEKKCPHRGWLSIKVTTQLKTL